LFAIDVFTTAVVHPVAALRGELSLQAGGISEKIAFVKRSWISRRTFAPRDFFGFFGLAVNRM